jgi:general stress protein CsbA
MRFSAFIPVVLSAAAFILTFLCLFAGSKKGFMEDYAIVTVSSLLLRTPSTVER